MGEEKKLSQKQIDAGPKAGSLYLSDGGGLRVRYFAQSAKHPKHGARVAEFHFSLHLEEKGKFKATAMVLGTIGNPFKDPATGEVRPFTIDDARAMRDAARLIVKAGRNPREARAVAADDEKQKEQARLIEIAGRRTFGSAFNEWHETYASMRHADKGVAAKEHFERYILPVLQDIRLDQLRRAHIVNVLDRLTAKGTMETANHARQFMRQVLKWAVTREYLDRNPADGITKADAGGKRSPRQRVLNEDEVKELYRRLPKLPERLRHVLPVILSTAVRVGEISTAEVAHFDLARRVWSIPAGNTKTQRAHLVHLSDHAVRHIKALIALNKGSKFVLPRQKKRKNSPDTHIDESAVTKSLADRQRGGPALQGRTPDSSVLTIGERWTAHDLRRTAATTMREKLRVSGDVVERLLNHVAPTLIGTYQTGPLLDERKEAFEAWGAYLDKLVPDDATVTERPAPQRRERIRL